MKPKFLVMLALFSFACCATAWAQESDRDRGIELYREGKYRDAIVMLENSVATNDRDSVAWIFLGGAYVHVGEEKKASKAFQNSAVKSTVPRPKYDSSVRITSKPRASYTESARQNWSSGTVRLAVEFRSDGTIGFVFPLPTTLDPDLVKQSIEAAKEITFVPAIKNGQPVTVIYMTEYGFYLR
jgi:hypothetical protein